MKKTLFALIFVYIIFLTFTLNAYAASYSENLLSLNSDLAKQYFNLMPNFKSIDNWDKTFKNGVATIENTGRGGGNVTYRVQNASSVKVGVLTNGGTRVLVAPNGDYILGVPDIKNPSISGSIPSDYSPSEGRVYASINGVPHRVYFDECYKFEKTDKLPIDIEPYGVHVSGSSDGKAYRTIRTVVIGSDHKKDSPYLYEEHFANIPSDMTYLRIEINTMTNTYKKDGTILSATPINVTCMGNLQISGDGLQLGVPEVIVSESELTRPPSSDLEESKSSSSKSSSSKASSSKVSSAKASSSSKAVAVFTPDSIVDSTKSEQNNDIVSKFEGVITSSSSSKKKTSSTAKAASKGKELATPEAEISVVIKESPPAVEESDDYQVEQEKVVYEVDGAVKSKDNFTTLVVVYIIIICAVILFVLLKPKKTE